MKKIFSAVLSVCMLMVIASGCASDQTGASASASASQTAGATAAGTDSSISPSGDNLMPVSYTHLDVYKRQIFCRPCAHIPVWA